MLWGLPFAIGPPLLSTDVYRAAAAGELERRGHSPYHQSSYALGAQRLVDAIDPSWRGAHSTDGPLSLVLSHLLVSVGAGSALAAVIVMRIVAVASVVALGRVTSDFAAGRRTNALCLTVLNPATLLFVVSAALYTGVVAALLIAGFLAAAQRRWLGTVLLACVAAGLRPAALVALPAIVLAHAVGRPAGRRLRTAGLDIVVTVAALAAMTAVVPAGLGWLTNLSTATRAHTPFAPSSAVGNLIGLLVSAASYDDLQIGGRVAAGAAGCVVLGYLYLTVRTRPLERTVGLRAARRRHARTGAVPVLPASRACCASPRPRPARVATG